VIWQFISSTEELGEGEVDETVEMDVAAESLEGAVETAVDGLIPILSKWVKPPSGEQDWQRPTADKIRDACNAARGHTVTVKKEDGGQGMKATAIRYFALLPEVDVVEVVDGLLESPRNTGSNPDVDLQSFWASLKSSNRISRRPHVTITHRQNLPGQQKLWDSCMAIDAIKAWPALFEFRLGTMLCDGNAMSIVVEDLRLHVVPPFTGPATSTRSIEEADDQTLRNTEVNLEESRSAANKAAENLLEVIPEGLKARLHITVGTRTDNIKPIEGGKLVERWKAGAKGVVSIPIVEKRVIGRVRGLIG
jgi:tRNA ligase